MQGVHLAEHLTHPDMGLRKMRRKLEPQQGEKGAGGGGEEESSQELTLTLHSEEFPALHSCPAPGPLWPL